MENKDKIVVIDENYKEKNCDVISIIEIDNKRYLIYMDGKELCASEVGKLDENLELIPITDDNIWNKLEEELKKMFIESHNILKDKQKN